MTTHKVNLPESLQGMELFVAALFLAIANFVVVLDMTIVNVSLPHIAGGLAISPNEGTYAITSYAVAEAITVPLTGWLALRFGTLRVFVTCILLFGLFSILCGCTTTLQGLVTGRLLQGLAGGPLMPLSQTLLMSIFPKNKKGTALGLWSVTTLVAPIVGPVVGGYISDQMSWHYIFLINVPIALLCGFISWRMLGKFETLKVKAKVDFVGMGLLFFWVIALQLMLDEGKKYDWFESGYICMLGLFALIGFLSFLIWELTQENPIVDLKIFRHRGFSISVLTISLAFGAFFSSVVLLPLWLQNYMGYTATASGFVSASMGCFAVVAAPFAAKLAEKYDPRGLVFFGVMWLGLFTFIRSFATTDMTSTQISLPILFQGIGLPFFFVPLTALALSSVEPNETASAAGLMNFLRTLAGAFAVSLVTTSWEDKTQIVRSDLSSHLLTIPEELRVLGQQKGSYIIDQLVQQQAVTISLNQIFLIVSFTFLFAATAVWFAPAPQKATHLKPL